MLKNFKNSQNFNVFTIFAGFPGVARVAGVAVKYASEPNAEPRQATKNTLDRINKGYGSVLSVFKRNAAFKREAPEVPEANFEGSLKQSKRSGLHPAILRPNDGKNNFLNSPSPREGFGFWRKRGFWKGKTDWFKDEPGSSTSKDSSSLPDSVGSGKFSVGRIPDNDKPMKKRMSMVENENEGQGHPSAFKRSKIGGFSRSDFMPLFKRYSFEPGQNHDNEPSESEMYKRFVPVTPDMLTFPYVKRAQIGTGKKINYVKLASQMADRSGPLWSSSGQAQKRVMYSSMPSHPSMLLMKDPNLADFGEGLYGQGSYGQGSYGQGLDMYKMV